MKKYLTRATNFLLLFSLLLSLNLPLALAVPEADSDVEISATESYQVPPITIEAKAALLVDLETEQVLYEQEADAKAYPASITKIMTALLTLEAVGREELSMNQEVTITEDDFYDMDEESSTAGLKPGETVTVDALLNCLLVASANEAANALAITVCGDVPSFVERMNARAKELGMNNTHFVNPHGLHDKEHYTTARDIYLMAREAMTHAVFRNIVATKQYTLPATDFSEERTLSNTNGLLTGYHYPGYSIKGTVGIKTGSTGQAGYCLCAAVKREGHTMLSVVLGAKNPKIPHKKDDVTRMQFTESARLQEWGFENFSYVTLLDADATKEEVAVRSSFQDNHVILRPAESVTVLIPGPYQKELTDLKLELAEDPISQSISEGETLGTMTVSYNGVTYGVVDMVAVSSVSHSPFLSFVDSVNAVLGNIYVRILLLAALLFIIVGLSRRLYHAKQDTIAAVRAKGRAAREVRQAKRVQARQDRDERLAQRQVEYEERKEEERLLKAQRAKEREEERARRAEEERLRREEEARARKAEAKRRKQEEARRREQEARREEEQRAARRERERRQRAEDASRRGQERNRPRREDWDDRSGGEGYWQKGWERQLLQDRENARRGYDRPDRYQQGRDYGRPRDTRWEDYERRYREEYPQRDRHNPPPKNRDSNRNRRGNPPPRHR